MIVLEQADPTDDIWPHLPGAIQYIDRDRFVAWYERANPKSDYRRPMFNPS
jgi:hypothetical protein